MSAYRCVGVWSSALTLSALLALSALPALFILLALLHAEVAKLADAPDLGSGGAILRGSSPLLGICFEVQAFTALACRLTLVVATR